MTLKDLSQLYWLNREIDDDLRRLKDLERLASAPSTPSLSGMPHAQGVNDSKVERMAAEIVDLQAVIAAKRIQCIHERARLERWIADIPDSQTRQIFRYRFVDGLPWIRVANAIGGGSTEEGVKKRCYRYMKEIGEN